MFPVFFVIDSVLELPASLPEIRLDPIGEDESRQHLFHEEINTSYQITKLERH
jgi:hypothetical protein